MKKTKVIIPSLGLLLLSTAASVTGTVAWFSANASVKVSGMSVTTKVAGNLLIAGDTLANTAKLDDSLFGSSFTDTKTGILEPVSTVDGANFFYTTDAKANGDAENDVYKSYATDIAATPTDTANFDNVFEENYGVKTAVGYMDYIFQLKAVNPDSSAKEIRLTNLTLKYGGTTDDSLAYRVAFCVQDITSAAATAGFVAPASGIYAPSSAQNQSDAGGKNYAIAAAASAPAQLSVDGGKYNNLDKIGEVAATSTGYFKVIARLYLEGEDKTCTNTTFLPLTNSWALNLTVSMDGTTANVDSLAKE